MDTSTPTPHEYNLKLEFDPKPLEALEEVVLDTGRKLDLIRELLAASPLPEKAAEEIQRALDHIGKEILDGTYRILGRALDRAQPYSPQTSLSSLRIMAECAENIARLGGEHVKRLIVLDAFVGHFATKAAHDGRIAIEIADRLRAVDVGESGGGE